MAPAQKRTFSLPPEQARFIDFQVRAGAYASGSEVVRAGLRALKERDAAVEQWLKEEVAPVYDAMKADPKRGMSAKKSLQPFELITRHGLRRQNLAPRVAYSPEAAADIIRLYDYIAEQSGPARAFGYICRIETYCAGLRYSPERGTSRDDIRRGLRITGFERRVTIAFHVDPTTVTIDRILYGGRNVARALRGRRKKRQPVRAK